ncbi:hypothetical protein, partial [Allocoleopsis sp.]|uniref:hypothetical protein n=1 Tax=Allocoleopsis sp. TaxID=3088169 RepID=UPI002FD7124C
LQGEVENLLEQLKEINEVEYAELVAVESAPRGSKALGGFLLGVLTAEINPANIKALMGFLSDRLLGKTVEMEVEANGKKLKVKATNQAELMAAIQAAQDFVAK